MSDREPMYPEPIRFMQFVECYLYSDGDISPVQVLIKDGPVRILGTGGMDFVRYSNGVPTEIGEVLINENGLALVRYPTPCCHPAFFHTVYNGYLFISRYIIMEGPCDGQVHLRVPVERYLYSFDHIVSYMNDICQNLISF